MVLLCGEGWRHYEAALSANLVFAMAGHIAVVRLGRNEGVVGVLSVQQWIRGGLLFGWKHAFGIDAWVLSHFCVA